MARVRRDLSPFLVHLTRDYEGTPADENLVSILTSGVIEARNPYGIAIRHLEQIDVTDESALATQRVACFSETPPDDLHGLVSPGIWRRYTFRPYGIAFDRNHMLYHGVNPVWYLNSYQGTHDWLAHEVNELIDAVAVTKNKKQGAEAFAAAPIARLTPYMEVIGEWGAKKKDFTFEREWRHVGDFRFAIDDVAAVITPPNEGNDIREQLTERWGEARISDIAFRELTEEDATSGA
jgi:hypothetical protein